MYTPLSGRRVAYYILHCVALHLHLKPIEMDFPSKFLCLLYSLSLLLHIPTGKLLPRLSCLLSNNDVLAGHCIQIQVCGKLKVSQGGSGTKPLYFSEFAHFLVCAEYK